MSCIKINVSGDLEYIEHQEVSRNITNRLYRLVELYDYDYTDYICIYGKSEGEEGFNIFEFEYGNYIGDVYVVRYSYNTREILPITIEEFLEMYNVYEELNSEEETTESDTYDYSDNFIIDDRE